MTSDSLLESRNKQRARAEKAETERNEWEARAVRAEEALEKAREVAQLFVSYPGARYDLIKNWGRELLDALERGSLKSDTEDR